MVKIQEDFVPDVVLGTDCSIQNKVFPRFSLIPSSLCFHSATSQGSRIIVYLYSLPHWFQRWIMCH